MARKTDAPDAGPAGPATADGAPDLLPIAERTARATPQAPGLGRVYRPDPRDQDYPLTPGAIRSLAPRGSPLRAVATAGKPRERAWVLERGLSNQGATPHCVAYAANHCLEAAPYVHDLQWDAAKLRDLYRRAQKQDGFPLPHDGTTARAMMRVLQEDGLITAYLWAQDEDQVRAHLLERGPLMLGSDWFTGMDDPGAGAAYVTPEGEWAGGHETLIRWYYGPRHKTFPDTYELVNSWGESWGDRGLFRLKAEHFRYLFLQLNGDVVLPVEAPKPSKPKRPKSPERGR
jgi:hypothetical protein